MGTKISDEAEHRLEELKALYPDPRSAVMPALYIAQEELGVLEDEAVQWVSERLDIPPVHVQELVTFYTMYHQRPVGRYHIQLCRTLSCALCGKDKLLKTIRERLGVDPGEVTADGMWSYEEVECLGSCGTAPMCEINDTFFENLTPEELNKIMDLIEKDQPDLSFSTKQDRLGAGLSGYAPSAILKFREEN